MITDEILEKQLDDISRIEPQASDKFQSVEEFKQSFFARVQAEESKEQEAAGYQKIDRSSLLSRIFGKERARSIERGFPSIAAAIAPMRGMGNSSFLGNHSFSSLAPGVKACFKHESHFTESSMGFDMPLGSTLPDDFTTEEYKSVDETPFVAAARNPLSTFGADVDTAGYTNARRIIMENDMLPPKDAVRADEFINYFRYDYPKPEAQDDLRPHFELADAPWAPNHKLLLVGIQARDIDKEKLPPSNYVFLIDNSGSMDHVFKMVKEALGILTRQLRPQDKVSIVTYGGEVRIVLEGSCDTKAILSAIEKLNCSGYTPGGEAIQKAYKLAHEHFVKGGNNRIILITDGDFNVGASSEADLTSMVEKERGVGIYLSVVGAGCGNYKDNRMKMLANKGDGNYIYIDNVAEARRAFTQGLTGQMYTLAHDVKFQLEFNPAHVYAYRLIGYELRRMEDTDFRDDTKDSGEIGVGQQVTALYELIMTDAPADVKSAAVPEAPSLRYTTVSAVGSDELLTFHLRYQQPEGGNAVEKEYPVASAEKGANVAWASAVAGFTLLLRDSKFKGNANYNDIIKLAKAGLGPDTDDDRLDFIHVAQRAASIAK